MNDQIDEIKRKSDIVSIVGQYVNLKKAGSHYKGLCPFHKEKTPSFTVNEDLGLYKCFGCGVGGDVIKFVMEIEGMDFMPALESLASKLGIKLENNFREKDPKNDLYALMDLATRYFAWLLVESKSGEVARNYLKERGISKEIVEKYKLGFSLTSWDGLINYLVKKKKYSIDTLFRTGLVVKRQGGGYYDKFRGRLMFPLFDSGGRVVGFTGRVIPALAKTDEPKYLNSPETEIYHKGKVLYGFHLAKQAIRKSKRVILVEGQMDQISSYTGGVTETVAVSGTAITEDQIEMLGRLAEKIYISLDNDVAGYVAMKKTVSLAEKRGLGIKIVQIDGGKDPDEISRNSPAKWKKMVNEGVDIYEFILNRSLKVYGKDTVEGIKNILDEVTPFLSMIENAVIREVWIKRLSETLGVSNSSVAVEVNKKTRGGAVDTINSLKDESKKNVETKIDKMTRILVANIILENKYLKKTKKIIEGFDGSGALWKLLLFVLSFGEKIKDGLEIVKDTPEEIRELANDIYMSSEDMKLDEKGFGELLVSFAQEKIKETRSVLYKELEKAEKLENSKLEEEIVLKLRDLGQRQSKLFEVELL